MEARQSPGRHFAGQTLHIAQHQRFEPFGKVRTREVVRRQLGDAVHVCEPGNRRADESEQFLDRVVERPWLPRKSTPWNNATAGIVS